MKLTILFTISLLALADELPKPDTPKPIPAAERESIHLAQKVFLAARVDLLSYREEQSIDTLKLRQLEARAMAAGKGWVETLEGLRKKYDAKPDCQLDLTLAWYCEPEKK